MSGEVYRTPDLVLSSTERITNAKINRVGGGTYRVGENAITNRELSSAVAGGFETIATLRGNTETFTDGDLVEVTGYYAATDKSGGPAFIYDESDTTTADDGFTCIVDANSKRYKRTAFDEPVNVKWAGAKGDDSNDDTSAIQTVLDWMLSSGRRGKVIIPPGTYKTSSTLTIKGASVEVEGEASELATIIKAYHASGPIVRLKNRRQALRNVEVESDSTLRLAAAGYATYNHGIVVEEDDTAGLYPTHVHLENIYVQQQPASGIVLVGGCWFGKMERCTVRDCGAHGIVWTDGTYPTNSGYTARTNRDVPPGISDVNLVEVFDNDGNGIVAGNPYSNRTSDRCIRMQFRNIDVGRNAQASGSRLASAQFVGFMDTSFITHSAFDGKNQAETDATTRCMEISGKNITVQNNRMLNPTPQAVSVEMLVNGFETENIVIEDNYIVKGSTVTWPTSTIQAILTPSYQNIATDGAITSGTDTVTSASAPFTAGDVGEFLTIYGAGAAGANLTSKITVYNSTTSVDIEDDASTTVSGAIIKKGYKIPTIVNRRWSGGKHFAENPYGTNDGNTVSFQETQVQYLLADKIFNNDATASILTDDETETGIGLSIPVLANQRVTFEANIFVVGDVSADCKVSMNFPSSASYFWCPVGGARIDGSDAWAQQDVIGTPSAPPTTSIAFGTHGTNTRLITLRGYCLTNGTEGYITVWGAQGSAVVADTTFKKESYLVVHK